MKKIGIIIAVILVSTLTVFGQKDKVEVKVDGLGCPFCAYGLEKKFKGVDGIKKIKIDLESAVMTFTVPAMDIILTKEVADRVESAGYTPVNIVINRANGKVIKWKNKTAIPAKKEKEEGDSKQ